MIANFAGEGEQERQGLGTARGTPTTFSLFSPSSQYPLTPLVASVYIPPLRHDANGPFSGAFAPAPSNAVEPEVGDDHYHVLAYAGWIFPMGDVVC